MRRPYKGPTNNFKVIERKRRQFKKTEHFSDCVFLDFLLWVNDLALFDFKHGFYITKSPVGIFIALFCIRIIKPTQTLNPDGKS